MHDDSRLVERRAERALRRIRGGVTAASVACTVAARPVTDPGDGAWSWIGPAGAALVSALEDSAFTAVQAGEPWGAPWSTTWFKVSGRVPPGWAGRRVELRLDIGFSASQPGFQAEALLYSSGGAVLRGLHPRNCAVPVALLELDGGGAFTCLVEAVAIPPIMGGEPWQPTTLGSPATAGGDRLYRFAGAVLELVDEQVRALAFDCEVALGLLRQLPTTSPRRHELLRALERAVDAVDLAGVAPAAKAARAELAEVLAAPASHSAHHLTAVGHAHIDSAWLWPLAEAERKCARSFSSVTALLREHPELVFACSQAQQWDWMRAGYPGVYASMLELAREGRFVPVGGMWVEADTNLPGGESLARQLLYGKRFFLEHTGVECEEVWLPDCFGYSAALPQLIAHAGGRWFLTQKLSWNDTNRFPHHSFFWEGIDGTRVFAHFPPVDTYNAELTPAELARAERAFAESGKAGSSLVPFGYGDGGGGPTAAMLERAARQHDLEGSPRCRLGSPAGFFRAAEEEYPDAPVWSGELYFERHRGTLTSQAELKRLNRRCEHLLREAELWWASASVNGVAAYPYEQLERLWKLVLLHQFHDILPGSSIAQVNDEAVAALAGAERELDALAGAAAAALAGPGETLLAFNAAPHRRAGVPALGAGVEAAAGGAPARVGRDPSGRLTLANGLLEVTLGEDGLLESLTDLEAGRQLVPPGERANLLQLHPDYPAAWDAWDVDRWYGHGREDLLGLSASSVLAAGPDEVAVALHRSFGASRALQVLRLGRGEKRLRIETELDWHEQERLLKLAIPLDLHVERSTAEIQFGHLSRSTAVNTSWDAARFELCGHRYVHLAEGSEGYGVAVVNDSLYGHDVSRHPRPGGGLFTTLRLSLVRGPRFPDPRADAGVHRSVVEIWPGATLAAALAAGYACNLPLRRVRGAGAPQPLVAVEPEAGVVVEAVKAAEDRSGDVVVRCYEPLGVRARATLRASFALGSARRCDLLERPLEELVTLGDNQVELSFRPFEIATLRLRGAGADRTARLRP